MRLAYAEADRVAAARVPYVFGGAHGVLGFRSPIVWKYGVDCSSGASIVLSAGGLLASPRASYAFDTEMFERWGIPGAGRYLTLWVLDSSTTHHCVLEFHGSTLFRNRYWQATRPGGGVGWIGFDPSGFNARHWPGT